MISIKNKYFLFPLLVLLIVLLYFKLNTKNEPKKSTCTDCNVIVIAYDALQANHVFHLGYQRETTPMLDSIAKNGISFKNNISAASWTVPSYMSIFTGLYPSEHKVVNKFVKFTKDEQVISNLGKLSPNVKTLANVFKENGYITGGFTGDAGVGAQFGYNQGFDEYFDGESFGSVEAAGKKALEWLKNNQGKKFFLFLHGYDNHGQFKLPEDYKLRFYPVSHIVSKYNFTPKEQRDLREEGLAKGSISLTEDEVTMWRLWYDSKIRDADDRVAAFWQEFGKLASLDKTIVVVLSDHGTEFYEHKKFDHGHSLYDELVRVPLVISGPNLPKDKIVDSQTSTMDIAPTILDLVGIKPDNQFLSQQKGKSLVGLIEGKSEEGRDVFMETDYRNYTHKRGIRTADGYKYILTMENGQKELYNLKTDPQEQKNILDDNLKLAFELDNKVKKHLQDLGTNPQGPWDTACLPVYGDQCK